MYGGSKLRRGGGGGYVGIANKRNSFPPPQTHRIGEPSSSNRLSLASSATLNRAAGQGSGASAGGKAVEETFSLVSGNNPLAFAMIIRLAPDLVEEIKKVESQGGAARIKFDSTGHNPNGNVIDASGKEFRFTWSREFGDLCDIYEECHSGEDGNGLLVESGCAWRKLNVQRILDESTTNHVKMRSVEAEQKHKSRKAIVLDNGNPSMKSQIKQLAAVEANTWKPYKQKKEPLFKKQKVETLQIGGPPKSTYKSGGVSTASLKAGRPASPLPSPPGKSGTLALTNGSGNIVKNHVNTDELTPIQVKSKENAPSSEKEIPTRTNSSAWDTAGGKGNSGAKLADLKNMLITLLMENPKGMSLKALEKAVGDVIPVSAKKIDPIIKKIATLKAQGRYSLKPGVELDSSQKPSSQSGSSPEDDCQQTTGPENIHDQTPAPGPCFVGNDPCGEMEEQAQSNSKLGEESISLEKIDVQHHSPDLIGEKKVSDNSEGHAASSSGSGSDSDSESDSSDSGSDSGSRSRSRSRSKSAAGSGTGSSSDSESDDSSNSKEASDEDVDIMTSDDYKEPKNNLPISEPALSPIPWKSDDSIPLRNEINEKQDDDVSDAIDIEGHGSDAIDTEKDSPDDGQEINIAVNTSLAPSEDAEKTVEGNKNLTDHDEFRERQSFIGNLFEDKETRVKDSFRHERSITPEKTGRNKLKKGHMKHIDEIPERGKRSKVESLTRPPISEGRDTELLESPHNLSPNRFIEDPYNGPATQVMSRADRERNVDFVFQKRHNQEFPGKHNLDFQQSGRKSCDQIGQSKAHDAAERPNKHDHKIAENCKISERSFQTQNQDGFVKEKKGSRNFIEGGAEAKNSGPFDSNNGKHGEMVEKFNEAGQASSSHNGNGKVSVLQREYSDLELGELRESLPNEAPIKKQFDRKGSFKQSENKSSTSDNYNPDLSKGKLVGKATLETGKTSPPNFKVRMQRTPENHVEDSTRAHQRVGQSQSQYLSRVDHAEVGSQFMKSVDASSKSRQIESGVRLGGFREGYGEIYKKATSSALQHDSKRGLVSQSAKENKAQKVSNAMEDLVDGLKDTIMTESNDSGRKRREFSSDEDTCSYYKLEKDEPELKGPVKDFSQYKEYMQEYCDKYDSYLSLNKTLERYRNKFLKLGKGLEVAKGKDQERYCKLLGQLQESYRQCGPRHERLKKIFVVLHEELKHLKQRMKDFAHTYMKD